MCISYSLHSSEIMDKSQMMDDTTDRSYDQSNDIWSYKNQDASRHISITKVPDGFDEKQVNLCVRVLCHFRFWVVIILRCMFNTCSLSS